jgi:hypothetical protein
MNYSVVQLLQQRIPRDSAIFEFGSGNSTEFWARNCASIYSVEYDRQWYNLILPTIPSNAKLYFCELEQDGAYCRYAAIPNRKFEVIVIDGRDRVNCLINSLEYLTPDGVIVLDDSDRERYQPAFEIARSAGFHALSLTGLKPTGIGADTTTIFYRQQNCLDL